MLSQLKVQLEETKFESVYSGVRQELFVSPEILTQTESSGFELGEGTSICKVSKAWIPGRTDNLQDDKDFGER